MSDVFRGKGECRFSFSFSLIMHKHSGHPCARNKQQTNKTKQNRCLFVVFFMLLFIWPYAFVLTAVLPVLHYLIVYVCFVSHPFICCHVFVSSKVMTFYHAAPRLSIVFLLSGYLFLYYLPTSTRVKQTCFPVLFTHVSVVKARHCGWYQRFWILMDFCLDCDKIAMCLVEPVSK